MRRHFGRDQQSAQERQCAPARDERIAHQSSRTALTTSLLMARRVVGIEAGTQVIDALSYISLTDRWSAAVLTQCCQNGLGSFDVRRVQVFGEVFKHR